MSRPPEMEVWEPPPIRMRRPADYELAAEDEDWRLLKGLLIGLPMSIGCWFGILWATPRVWALLVETVW